MICSLHQSCPGCGLWHLSYGQQIVLKKKKLSELLNINLDQITFLSAGEYGLRTRFDFIIKNKEIGLIDRNRNLISIDKCLQLNSELQKAFDLIQSHLFDIRIGTLRIRSSKYESKFGLWLDFANTDIKKLLTEKKQIDRLKNDFLIEVGQKKKTISDIEIDSQYKLIDPKPSLWFETLEYTPKGPIATPLYCAVSSFTQPGPETAKLIVQTILNWTSQIKTHDVWEFGSGIGQYTLPLLSQQQEVTVFESDEFALECLKLSLKDKTYASKLNILRGDFQNIKNLQYHANNKKPQLCLVNPPKSGLKDFSRHLYQIKPEYLIYISCFPETMNLDLRVINQDGDYTIKDILIIDQFPQTEHYEVACLLQRV